MTNTNRLAQKEPALIKGAIISTATALLFIVVTTVVAHGKPMQVEEPSTRQEILTLLRLMSLDHNEYKCNKEIIRKESNFNPSAKNGSHYGLPQGRTRYLASATIKQQIQWYIKYVRTRYEHGCIALKHHQKYNWY